MDISVAVKEQKGVMDTSFFIQDQSARVDGDAQNPSQDYLATQIINTPSDLRSHAKRIFCMIKQQNREAIYGALVDLFFVLDKRGLSLRKRLLINAHSLLTDHEFDYLKNSLATGLTINTCSTSLLSKQSKGESLVENIKRKVNDNAMSAMDEAKHYVEQGLHDEAIIILQKAILTCPKQLALHHDLLEIFQKTAKRTSFILIYRHLLDSDIALPSLWSALAEEFSYE